MFTRLNLASRYSMPNNDNFKPRHTNVNLAQNTDGDTESELSWVLPSAECFDQFLLLLNHGSQVTYTPTGDGSTLTANSIFGSGDDVGSNQYVVYKETGTGLTINWFNKRRNLLCQNICT